MLTLRPIALAVVSAALITPAYAQLSGKLSIAQPAPRTAGTTVKTYVLRPAWPKSVAIADVVFANTTRDGLPRSEGPGRGSFVTSDPTYIAALRTFARNSTPILLRVECQGRRSLVHYTITGARIVSMQPDTPTAGDHENMNHEMREHVAFTYEKITWTISRSVGGLEAPETTFAPNERHLSYEQVGLPVCRADRGPDRDVRARRGRTDRHSPTQRRA
jgi:hypothetical protein